MHVIAPSPPPLLTGVVYGVCEARIEPAHGGSSYVDTAGKPPVPSSKDGGAQTESEAKGMGSINPVWREFFERHR